MGKKKNKISEWLSKEWWKGVAVFVAVILAAITVVVAIIIGYKKPPDIIQDDSELPQIDTTAIKDTVIIEPIKIRSNIERKGEGFGEDMYDKDEARKLAKEMAMNDLFNQFPKVKESIIRRYAKTVKDTVEQTRFGTWKANIILSVKESDIIKQ